jgi:hypothetical protein
MQQSQDVPRSIAKRKDPGVRSVFGASPMYSTLKNKRSDRDYCLVNPGDSETFSKYESLGWIPEVRTKDCALPISGCTAKEGEPIRVMGQLLMSIDKEAHQRIIREGEDGQSGLNAADELEQRLIRNRMIDDPSRNLRGAGRYIRFEQMSEKDSL